VVTSVLPVATPAGAGAPSIAELLRGGATSWSFEFFPPKGPADEPVLWDALRRLERLRPTFVSVTYGAGGSTSRATVAVTERIAAETTLTPLAHLTAVGHSLTELRRLIGSYAGVGVRNVLALRGDPPGDPLGEWVRHPEGLQYATELVELVRELGDFCVGVAAFPDVHPRARDAEPDADVLAAKFAAGADYALTQMFFDPSAYFRLLDRLAIRGVDAPVIPGVMPVTNVRQVERFAQLSGTPFPVAVAERLHAVEGDAAAVRAVGVEVATELCSLLLAGGAPGVHFITLNRSTATGEVYANLTANVTANLTADLTGGPAAQSSSSSSAAS